MAFTIRWLIVLALALPAWAGLRPSGALADPDAGLPGPPAGQLSLYASGARLNARPWSDTRTRFGLALGLGRGLCLSAGSSLRELRGYGAYQRGIEDTRLGLSLWNELTPRFSAGLNGYFVAPTGFRRQESYYDPQTATTGQFPAFSLGQSAGEVYAGGVWLLGPAAELSAYAGYVATSDRISQAFRWGLGALLTPLGPKYAAELGYGHSIVRTGPFPNTEYFSLAVPLEIVRGVTLVPGFNADLSDDPFYGASLGLRFTTRMTGGAVLPGHARDDVDGPPLPRLAGRVLVAPPLCDFRLADGAELWRSIQSEVKTRFEETSPLLSLDQPGLPYDDANPARVTQSLRAIAAAHPEARWLLIARVEHEAVSRAKGVSIPFVISQPAWTAQCQLRVELVDLCGDLTREPRTVEGRALQQQGTQLPLLATPENDGLSLSASRALTLEAYREAGREIARDVCRER